VQILLTSESNSAAFRSFWFGVLLFFAAVFGMNYGAQPFNIVVVLLLSFAEILSLGTGRILKMYTFALVGLARILLLLIVQATGFQFSVAICAAFLILLSDVVGAFGDDSGLIWPWARIWLVMCGAILLIASGV